MKLPERYKSTGSSIAGGMGSVIPCQDSILERKVAIKILKDITEQRRIEDELNALLSIRSKHVVQVYDVIKVDKTTLGIVQEFIEGEDLFHPNTSPANLSEYYSHLLQIASGIRDIHKEGIIHRDIKPNNMKKGADGIIKIFDFGLSRSAGPQAQTMGFVGTFGFSAPELFNSTTTSFTEAIDTYSFGATAFHLAANDLPDALKAVPPKPIPKGIFGVLRFALPEDVSDMLEQCLSPSPEARPRMETVTNLLSRYVLYNKHRALVVVGGKSIHYLDQKNRVANLSVTNAGKIKIEYNGHQFKVTECSGDVFINNTRTLVGQELPESCVIVFGSQNPRVCVTFDISNPEVVL